MPSARVSSVSPSMESSVRLSVSNPSLPRLSHSLHSSRPKAQRNFSGSSSFPSRSTKGLYVRCCPQKQMVLKNTNIFSPNRLLCTRKNGTGFLYSVVPNKEAGRNYNLLVVNQNKLSRNIVVRSELAETGAHGAAYPLSDPQLLPKVRGICFYIITSLLAIIVIAPMFVAHPFVLLLDTYCRKVHHIFATIWATFSIYLFFKVEFEGLENLPSPDAPAVYVSNHQSFLDIYTLLTLGRSFKFISKRAIFIFPIVGWAMFMMGVIPLKRMDSRSQLDCLKRCINLVKKGASVFFFPEGTRSKDGKLGAFKKGAFSVAAKTRVPVVPITLMGTGKIMPAGMEGILNPGCVKVVIHKPIEGTNADTLCSESRSRISEALTI